MKKIVLLTLTALGPRLETVASDASDAEKALGAFERRADDWKARMEALASFARAGDGAVPILVDALGKGPPAVRGLATQALEILADTQARPALVEVALSDETPAVRAAAVRALSACDPTDPAREIFRALLKDRDHRVRLAAAWALERDDGSSAAAATREALRAYDLSRVDSARLHEPAPDFSLVDPSGRVHRLADLTGKAVVLEFYNEPL